MQCSPYWLLALNMALFVWAGFHADYAATFEFPDVMTSQSCCKGDRLPSGDCCPGRITNVRGDWECYWHDNDWTATEGVLADVKRYRWCIFVALIGAAFTPYHAPIVWTAGIQNKDERFGKRGGGYLRILIAFAAPWLGLFIYANVILGYGLTIDCDNPDTPQYLMVYYHAPYDFWILVLGAWVVPAIVAAVIALVIAGSILALTGVALVSLVRVCLGIGAEPPRIKRPACGYITATEV